MDNQTLQNDESNRGENKKNEPQNELRSIWLGIQDVNQTFYEELEEVDVGVITELLDDGS